MKLILTLVILICNFSCFAKEYEQSDVIKKFINGKLIILDKQDQKISGKLISKKDGKVISRNSLLDGTLDGITETYYPNGFTQEKSFFTNGELDGLNYLYFENGKIQQEANYKNGKLDGSVKQFNEKGELINEYKWVDGVLEAKGSEILKVEEIGLLDRELLNLIESISENKSCPDGYKGDFDKSSEKFITLPRILVMQSCTKTDALVNKIEYLKILENRYIPVNFTLSLNQNYSINEIQKKILNNKITKLAYTASKKDEYGEYNAVVFSIDSQKWSSGEILLLREEINSISLYPKVDYLPKVANTTIRKFAEMIRFAMALGTKKSELRNVIEKAKKMKLSAEELGFFNEENKSDDLYQRMDDSLKNY